MRRILFVDDEPNILEGLRNLLRKQRKSWDMVFCVGAEAALVELSKQPFDVVVSDMRMPGMDGATFLARVRDTYPAAARIVLSGYAEQADILRALPVAHQFLNKPCEEAVLRGAIHRAAELQSLLSRECVRGLVGKIERLPSLPRTYAELSRVAADPDCSVDEVAAVVAQDPAMSLKTLQLANSGYFGAGQRVASIRQAATYLGVDLLKGLSLCTEIFASFASAEEIGLDLDELQADALKTALLSKAFLSNSSAGRAEEAFATALVHDVGRVIMAMAVPTKYREVMERRRSTGSEVHLAEKTVFGVTHAEIGAYLLGVWGLPVAMVEAVAYHHNVRGVGDGEHELLAATYVADHFVEGLIAPSMTYEELTERLDMEFLKSAGAAERLVQWQQIAAKELRA